MAREPDAKVRLLLTKRSYAPSVTVLPVPVKLKLLKRLPIPAPPDVLRRLTPSKPEWALGALERHFIAAIAVGETPRSPSEGLTRRLWVTAMKSRHGENEHLGNWDIENRWGRAYGTASTETIAQRFQRHTAGYRRWLSFVTETLVG